MASVQRLMMYLTPIWALDVMCQACPKTVIGLLCHWVNEKNPNLEERRIAARRSNFLPVAKKFSKLSTLSILNLLRQDESLWAFREDRNKKSFWQFYSPNRTGGSVISLAALPYVMLEIIYDLGGTEGREKVKEIVQRSRMTIGNLKQADILESFKIDTVLDIFEDFERTPGGPMEIKMRLSFSNIKATAMWLDHWDLRMQRLDKPMKSAYWIGQLSGERAFEVEQLLKSLEFRRRYDRIGDIYDRKNEWD